ncbi:M17 family metallopeptidase [Paraferrimonas sp. SM1919]|uniref:leucyl aminopeptidase family protein n=1 Tax=Paraferrimonas sp. SM1919 TaxID=2662263 RepID=UPI0013D5D18C|nr:leucyl aminopeptidase family protein [Paraferrimonas sp. SM1919]
MPHHIAYANNGHKIRFIAQPQYSTWLQQQPVSTQTWLTNSFNGKGFALIPHQDSLQVIVVVKDLSELWLAGDLSKNLPEGQYLLDADNDDIAFNIGLSWALGAYQFSDYKKAAPRATLNINDQELVEQIQQQVSAVNLVRDMVNTPASDMMPEDISDIMQKLATDFSGQFTEIVGDELLEQNYPTIHAVGRASVHAPRLLRLDWGNADAPKLTLVGKGVCFDSGGLDIKPAAGMRNMKKDMGGAAHVIGLAQLIMAAKLPVNLTVLVPAVENAISNNAFRPGDVITTRSGQTVEIDNTDAEGRLILCDALTTASSEDPELIIDFATLTGAMRIALGTELPGYFANDTKVANALFDAGEQVQDQVWRMPLYKHYRSLFSSTIADMSNCGSTPFGGAITAALYLENFVEKDIPWVHFDVMAFNTRHLPGRPVGGEAFAIRACFEYLQQRFS